MFDHHHAEVVAIDRIRRRPGEVLNDLDRLPLMLTIDEAAAVLRISRTSAYKLADLHRRTKGASGLPHVRFGGRLRVRRVDVARIVGLDPRDDDARGGAGRTG